MASRTRNWSNNDFVHPDILWPSKESCTESWKAADDGAKSVDSKQSDTGLFAAVCRHDVGLRSINLYKTGDKCEARRIG